MFRKTRGRGGSNTAGRTEAEGFENQRAPLNQFFLKGRQLEFSNPVPPVLVALLGPLSFRDDRGIQTPGATTEFEDNRLSPEVYRRTVYRTWIRSGRNHLLDVFDCPDPSTTAPVRAVTTTPIQSLALMNNSFALRMADRFAQRVREDVGADAAAQTNRVYLLAYGRTPSDQDAARPRKFIVQYGLPAFCRVVINSNEFIHVD